MSTNNSKKNIDTWQDKQDSLAEKYGLAIVLVEKEGLDNFAESNNNSICEQLTKSEKFAPKCQQFCGKVYDKAIEEQRALKYKCYAGLECVAIPIKAGNEKQFVAITGRTFTKSNDYRIATERAITGDWNTFAPTKFFENVLLTSTKDNLANLAKDISNLSRDAKQLLNGKDKDEKPQNQQKSVTDKKLKTSKTEVVKANSENLKEKLDLSISAKNIEDSKELREWRSLFNSLLTLEYKEACFSILKFIKKRYGISSIAWLENQNNKLKKILAIGDLETQEIQISMAMDDERLVKLMRDQTSIELKERNKEIKALESKSIRLFPILIGSDIKSALVIGERANDEELEKNISKFCDTVAFKLEILRLREELSRRSWLDVALQKFNDSLKMIDSEDFWSRLMQTTAELLQAERGSLLVYDEASKKLVVKSAIGSKSDFIKKIKNNVGAKVSKKVWESGEPMVIQSILKSELKPAPLDWKYKTESFISFPISIGNRKIGVLNLADKVDGSSYKEFDLQLLHSIIPQIAVAIDHATLKYKAGEFKQLSVTDSLTGLLNRRYLEERLDEEIKRSNRHGYPMSFLMIDVDDFGDYNNTFLHTEGDKALQIVGQCLRETLRGADIAARYGGEEFSILLPQTTLDEAEIIAERIRRNIETTRFPNRQVTVSIGIACISLEIDSVAELIKSADKALYAAKGKGKNNVQIFESQRREIRLPN